MVNRSADFFGNGQRLFPVSFRQQDGEFVSAVTRDYSMPAYYVFDNRREFADNPVAGFMVQEFIDFTAVVHVKHEK